MFFPKVATKKEFNRQVEKAKRYFGFNATFGLLIFCTAMLGIYYVWSVNSLSTVSYEIQALKNESNKLTTELQLLEVKLAELDSLSEIENSEDASIMEVIEAPDYLVIKEDKTYVYNR